MTLKRINCTPDETAALLGAMPDRERIMNVFTLYSGEHPDHGHVIVAMHKDTSATVFADEVVFLQDGSVPAPRPTDEHTKNRTELANTAKDTIEAFRKPLT